MEKRVLMVAFMLACGASSGGAQQAPMMQQAPPQAPQERQLQGSQTPRPTVEEDDSGITGWHPELGSRRDWGGDMRFGMMRRGWMSEPGAMQSGMMMRMLFALMDSDGDGTISLQEFQAAHERIFKAIDANKDGKLTLEEIQAFLRATRTSVPRQ